MKYLFTLALLLASAASFAQQPEETDKKAIREKINLFFSALEKKDTLLYKNLVLPGGQLWSILRKGDSLRIKTRSFEEDVNGLVVFRERLEERPYKMDMAVHHDIAVAWVPYSFSRDGKLSHCGIDVFTFFRTAEGWRILNLSYTVEPDGCEGLRKKYGIE
jgi:hypothetical protein